MEKLVRPNTKSYDKFDCKAIQDRKKKKEEIRKKLKYEMDRREN